MQTFDALAGVYIRDLQARNASVATIRTYEESFDTFRTGVPRWIPTLHSDYHGTPPASRNGQTPRRIRAYAQARTRSVPPTAPRPGVLPGCPRATRSRRPAP